MSWYDGHSGGVTPGPIPNPAVKPSNVPVCTVLRKRTGTQVRCQPLFPFYLFSNGYLLQSGFYELVALSNPMSPRNGNVMVAIVLIILMMAGSAGMFILFQTLHNNNPDPHEQSHDYTFEGTIDGIAYTGAGTTNYVQETLAEYDYILKYSIGPVSDQFFLAFTLDDKMVPKLFKFVGTDTIGDVTVDVWTYDGDGKYYKMYTAGKSILYRIEITSETMSIVGNVILDQ